MSSTNVKSDAAANAVVRTMFEIRQNDETIVASGLTYEEAKDLLSVSDGNVKMVRSGSENGTFRSKRSYEDIAKWHINYGSRISEPFDTEIEAKQELEMLVGEGAITGKVAEYAYVERRVLPKEKKRASKELSPEAAERNDQIADIVGDADGEEHLVGTWTWVADTREREDLLQRGFVPVKKHTTKTVFVYRNENN